VLGELAQVAHRHAAAPPDAGQLVGPPGGGEAGAVVVEPVLGDVDAERTDLGSGRRRGGDARSTSGQFPS
jgi:hypothetical protein